MALYLTIDQGAFLSPAIRSFDYLETFNFFFFSRITADTHGQIQPKLDTNNPWEKGIEVQMNDHTLIQGEILIKDIAKIHSLHLKKKRSTSTHI